MQETVREKNGIIKAAVFIDEGRLELLDCPESKMKRDIGVLLKVTGTGICGTDLHILQVPVAHPAARVEILEHESSNNIRWKETTWRNQLRLESSAAEL